MKIIIGRTKKGRIARLALLAVLVMSAAALAAWLTTSQSDARGRGASLTAPTVVSLSQVEQSGIAGDLFPGQLGSAWVKVTNPNSVDLYVSKVEKNATTVTVTGEASGGCSDPTTAAPTSPTAPVWLNPSVATGAGLIYVTADNVGGTLLKVTANASEQIMRLPKVLTMNANADNACQGDQFTVVGTGGALNLTWSTEAP